MSTNIESLRAAVAGNRASAAAWSALGDALMARDEIEEAAQVFEQAVCLEPHHAHYASQCGDALAAAGRRDEAGRMYLRAHSANPASAAVCERLGRLHTGCPGEEEVAAAWFARAIDLAPGSGDSYLGLCRMQVTCRSDADQVMGRILGRLGLATPPAALYRALAGALEEAGRYAEARPYWRELSGDLAALLGLTNNYLATREIEAADRCSLQALRVAPASPKAYADRARFLRMTGRVEEAKATFRRAFFMAPRPAGQEPPQWDGSPLEGKTILLKFGTGAGYGDLIQHVATARMLSETGARVVIECPQRRLHPLLRFARGVSAVALPYDSGPACDYQSDPIQALGQLEWSWDQVRACVPYFNLPASGPLAARGAEKLQVGVHWRGRDLYRHDAYQYRSVPCAELEPITSLPGVAAYSLQVRPPDGREALPAGVTDLGSAIGDFLGVARVILEMDLAVAVDSALAHLACSLGKRCLLMVPYFADTQWMLAAEPADQVPSRWYPTATIFRQARPGDWSNVLRDVLGALGSAGGPNPRKSPVSGLYVQ